MAPTRVTLPLESRAIPPPDRLELWLADLGQLPLDAGLAGPTRKEQLLGRRIRQQFVLRLLLGACLYVPGRAVQFTRSDQGKPALSGELADSGLCFNISHAGDWLAVVLGRDVAVGVDIETDRRLQRPRSLARRFFPADTADWLDGLDEPFLSRHFLQHWTAREALIKAAGVGIAGNLGGIALDCHPAALQSVPKHWPNRADWTLHELRLPQGLLGHVAADRSDQSIEVFELDTRAVPQP